VWARDADGGQRWKQLYTNTTDDPAYKADVLSWLRMFYKGLQRLPRRLLLVPNHGSHVGKVTPGPVFGWGSDAWNSTEMFLVGNHTDGILSEEGWTGYGGYLVTGVNWRNKLLFSQNLQRHGKAYFSVAYWGPNNTATHLPSRVTPAIEEYFLASYLLAKGDHHALFFGPNQCSYGTGPASCTCGEWCNRTVFDTAISVAVGSPLGPARQIGGLWVRDLSFGLAIVNPAPKGTMLEYQLDPRCTYQTRTGTTPASPLQLVPTSGFVLLRQC